MNTSRGWLIAGNVILAATAIAAATASWRPGMPVAAAQQPPPGPAITIDAFQFRPKELEIKLDAKVTWTNDDDVVHTVTDTRPPHGPVQCVAQRQGNKIRLHVGQTRCVHVLLQPASADAR